MKILSFILSLCVLTLSCFTCEDLPEYNGDDSNIISSITIKKRCSESNVDHCSPICICACCGQPVISFFSQTFNQSEKQVAISKKNFQYNRTHISNYIHSIWQPPKLNNYVIG